MRLESQSAKAPDRIDETGGLGLHEKQLTQEAQRLGKSFSVSELFFVVSSRPATRKIRTLIAGITTFGRRNAAAIRPAAIPDRGSRTLSYCNLSLESLSSRKRKDPPPAEFTLNRTPNMDPANPPTADLSEQKRPELT